MNRSNSKSCLQNYKQETLKRVNDQKTLKGGKLTKTPRVILESQILFESFYKNQQIRMDSRQNSKTCSQCGKEYKTEASMNIHLSLKHKDSAKVKGAIEQKQSAWEQTTSQIQDEILTVMGLMGEENAYSLEQLIELQIYDPSVHSAGKNHFTTNPAVYNPYESDLLESSLTGSIAVLSLRENKEIISHHNTFIDDVIKLKKSLDKQAEKWYFADPLDQSLDFSEEFTLDDIPKLIKNYYKKQLSLNNPELSILFLWLSQYVKAETLNCLLRICLFLVWQSSTTRLQNDGSKQGHEWREVERHLRQSKFVQLHYSQLGLRIEQDQFRDIARLFCQWADQVSPKVVQQK